jgi:Domain of unknown function (DUF6542)
VSQRTWQASASPSTLPRTPNKAGPGQPDEPKAKPGPASGAAAASVTDTGTAKEPKPGGVLLTGRGALVVVFALCLLGLAVSGWLHWGMLTGLVFVAASVLAAARTQRSDLLVVAVTPPALFLIAVICAKALGSAGDVLSTLEGTLITLANTAPWLIAGTVLSVIVAFSRGMWDNVRTLRKDLRGDPIRRTN